MKRNEWCKRENFENMYGFIYGRLVDKGLAEKWEEEKC
jgi:hypothetical protein